MMHCQRCNSKRIASVNAKTSDLCTWQAEGLFLDGYTPEGVGIGGGDYGCLRSCWSLAFDYCLDCGQMQGKFPISKEAVENLK